MKAVILDWGGVLTLEPSPDDLERLRALCGVEQESFVAAWWAPRLDYDLGRLGAAEYWRLVGLRDEAALEAVLAADAAAWGRPNLAVAAWLGDLKSAGFRTAVLSNVPREQWERLAGVYETWLAACDERTLSFELGLAKPDERIYRHCLDRLGVEPHEALFVDDRPENVDAARALGLEAIRFTGVAALGAEVAARFDGLVPLPGGSGQPVPA